MMTESVIHRTHKVYIGKRVDLGQCRVCVHYPDGRVRPLNPRNDVWNHSPDGFEWGYGGSGPAQLALAILCDALCDSDVAIQYHQAFKFEVISAIKGNDFELTHVEVLDTFLRIKKERANR